MHESSIYQGLIKNAFALILAKKQESRSQTLNSIIGRKQLGKRKAAGLGLGKLWSIRIYAHYRSPRAPPLKLGRKIEPFGPLSFPRRKAERPTSHESESSLAIRQPLITSTRYDEESAAQKFRTYPVKKIFEHCLSVKRVE